MKWNELNSTKQIDNIIQLSQEQTVVIFKHSTRCGISSMVLKSFQREVDSMSSNIEYYFLDLIAYREISNYIVKKLNIQHESPQMIVLKEGKVVHHSSHSRISASKAASY